jgi:hypothetical protein
LGGRSEKEKTKPLKNHLASVGSGVLFSQHWAMEALTSYFTDKKKEDEVQVKSQTVRLQDLLLFYCCCCCVCASLFLGFFFFPPCGKGQQKS